MIRLQLVLGIALSLGSAATAQTTAPAPPQARAPAQPDGAEYWTGTAERMTFTAAGISFPRRVGAVSFNRSIAFGRQNAGLDNGLIYASDDNALIATAYVYLPGLADVGLSAVVNEQSMRFQSGSGLRPLESRIANAGGRNGVAIRADYAGFRDNEASMSAFLRVGRWIVKLRVSGPESRRADVERTMTALLAETRFQGRDQPQPARAMRISGDCPATPAAQTATLRALNGAEAAEDAIMTAAAALPERSGREGFPRSWCLSSRRQSGPYAMPIWRIPPSSAAEDSRRSVALAMMNDSDGVIEVVERRFRDRSRYMLIWHSTGRTNILGSYDGLPTDAQITALLSGNDAAGERARAVIDYRSNGDSTVTLNVAPEVGS